MKKRTIAVDGPAGSGKNSISRQAALRTGLKYIDSGAVYRAITWFILEKYDSINNDSLYHDDIQNIKIVQNFDSNGTITTFLDGIDISQSIRDEKIAQNIGKIADRYEIRQYVTELLRKWSEKDSIIMDGRDVGTVIFPNADLKIYLDASVEVRAMRRIKEYQEMGKNVDENSVKKQIIQRDKEDVSRKFGALRKAENSVYIDTSDMTIDEVIERVKKLVLSVL